MVLPWSHLNSPSSVFHGCNTVADISHGVLFWLMVPKVPWSSDCCYGALEGRIRKPGTRQTLVVPLTSSAACSFHLYPISKVSTYHTPQHHLIILLPQWVTVLTSESSGSSHFPKACCTHVSLGNSPHPNCSGDLPGYFVPW